MKKYLLCLLSVLLFTVGCDKNSQNDNELTIGPEIETCPNCVYKFNENDVFYGDVLKGYTKDYRTIKKDVFVGYVLDEKDVVLKEYICAIFNSEKEDEKVTCLEGPVTNEIAQKDVKILSTELSSYFEECSKGLDTYKDEGVYCSRKTKEGIYMAVDRKINISQEVGHNELNASKDKYSCSFYGNFFGKNAEKFSDQYQNFAHCSISRY